jgi:RimJ/RimL family protein N-acetyltransferase
MDSDSCDIVRRGRLVELRRHHPHNRDAFVRWYRDPDIAELLRHDLEPLSEVQANGYFLSVVMPSSVQGTCWAIHDAKTGELVGSTAITDIDRATGTCLFRIVIGEKSAWGQGFGTEATSLAVAEAFETLGLKTVRLEVFSHNRRAQHAYLRVGFVQTGSHYEWVSRRRRQIHVLEMQLERGVWQARQSGAGAT